MTHSNNIPLQLTSFVGRRREIEEVTQILSNARLLTLTGPGGSGKTRLAVQVASELQESYMDGAWFVELAALDDPSLIPQSVASALFIMEQPKTTPLSHVTTYLRPLNLLLVMDNCEHLVRDCALFIDALLRACPNLTILVTSRQPLGLDYERTWHVPPLSIPPHGDLQVQGGTSEYEAVKLFVERARLKRSDFILTTHNSAEIAQLCSRLDGLPLAIELAAARVNVLSVGQILSKMEQPFRLLSNRSPTVSARQQTLQATIDWSYQLLAPGEQFLFRMVGVFASSFTLEAAVAVCGGEIDEYEAMDLIMSLVDKSLLVVDEQGAETRYRMLETMRHYARGKLALSREMPEVQGRFFKWYMELAERAEPELQASGQLMWLDRLDAELDNLRATIGLASDQGDIETAARTAAALWWFWCLRGYITEGRSWYERLLSLPWGEEHRAIRARLLLSAGIVATIGGAMPIAHAYLQESISLQDAHTHARTKSYTKGSLGFVMRLLGDTSGMTLMDESLAEMRQMGDEWGIAMELNSKAEIVLLENNRNAALSLGEEGLQAARRSGDRLLTAESLRILGRVSFEERDYERATHLYAESLRLAWTLGRPISTGLGLVALASFAANQGQPMRAARLFGAAQALLDARGASFQPHDRQEIDRQIAVARVQVDPASWERAWADGRDMQVERLVEYALKLETDDLAGDIGGSRKGMPSKTSTISASPEPTLPDGLTGREVEVLRLVTSGQTVRQVAEQLCISTWTVQAHVRSAYSKIGATSRSAATHYVIAHGLT